jgi:hypothetical protein
MWLKALKTCPMLRWVFLKLADHLASFLELPKFLCASSQNHLSFHRIETNAEIGKCQYGFSESLDLQLAYRNAINQPSGSEFDPLRGFQPAFTSGFESLTSFTGEPRVAMFQH